MTVRLLQGWWCLLLELFQTERKPGKRLHSCSAWEFIGGVDDHRTRRQDGEEEGLGRYFYPILWVGLCVERAVGNHGAGELAKVIGIIFDATLEECENLFYAQLLGDMNCVPPWGLLVCVTGIQIS